MNWEKIYVEKTMTAQEAVAAFVKNGDKLFVGGLTTATETVQAVVDAAIAGNIKGIEMHGNMLLGNVDFSSPKLTEDTLRYYSFFHGALERNGTNYGSVAFMPLHLRNNGRHLAHVAPDVAIVPITPPDEKGYCNIGPQGFTPAGMRNAKKIIGQITPGLARVYGSEHDYHVSQFTAFVLGNETVSTISSSEASAEEKKIAEYIVDRIPDGACIQLGIGGLANAVGFGLRTKKHLGIHSEMYTESMAELQAEGIVDNSRKTFMPNRSVAGFALGPQKEYDYIDRNPHVYFTPYDFVNDVANIAANDNMMSINNALSIDLVGQVCSESIGFRHYSGSGGQVDYIRGATLSKGGQSFIAVSSVAKTKQGDKSRIVLNLEPGSIVTSLRAEVQNIVTEYGCVSLEFCDIPTRAKRLISIAHPDFREELTFNAKKHGLLY